MIGDGTAELKKYQSKQEVDSSFAFVGRVRVELDYWCLESSWGIPLHFQRQGAPKAPLDLNLKLDTKSCFSNSSKPGNFLDSVLVRC